MAGKKKLSTMYREVLAESFPDNLTITLGDKKLLYMKRQWAAEGKKAGLRYGDNPGQQAALYELKESNFAIGGCEFIGAGKGLASSISDSDLMESGKHIGKSNLTDVDNALSILKNFDEPTAVIMKHNNPCGAASREAISDAYREAYMADRLAAFGGVAALNRNVDTATAQQIMKQYLEVVAAPDFENEALEMLLKKKNMRLIRIRNMSKLRDYRDSCFLEFKSLMDGGMIVQQSQVAKVRSRDDLENASAEKEGKETATRRKPTEKEYEDLLFAWKIAQGTVSNAIVFAKNKATTAICPGEQDRVGAVEIAINKAYKKYADRLSFERFRAPYAQLQPTQKNDVDAAIAAAKGNIKGSVMASDGFFPFRDSVDLAAGHGATAIIQPGGSLNDYEVIEACNEQGMAMVFTGQRVFRH